MTSSLAKMYSEEEVPLVYLQEIQIPDTETPMDEVTRMIASRSDAMAIRMGEDVATTAVRPAPDMATLSTEATRTIA